MEGSNGAKKVVGSASRSSRFVHPSVTDLIWFLSGILLAGAFCLCLWLFAGLDEKWVDHFINRHPNYLANHPDLLKSGQEIIRSRYERSLVDQRRHLIADRWPQMLTPGSTPVIGNPDGNTILLEFTDYTCTPCRQSAVTVQAEASVNPDLRVTLLVLPTTGAVAELAARIAFCAYRLDRSRFDGFHDKLMKYTGILTEKAIMNLAGSSGYDIQKLAAEVGEPAARDYVEKVRSLSSDVGIRGVPAFLLNGKLLQGGVGAAQMAEFLKSSDTDKNRLD